MPNHSIKMIKLRQVFGLYGSGYGSRSISTTLGISRTTIRKYLRIFNESYAPIWPPANHFLKDLMLAGLPQLTFKKVWHFRARRNSFPEWFGVPALGETHFPNGLEFPRMAKVVSRMVWHFRAWRKSFPERFGVSAHGESYFPNGLELVVAKIWKLTVQRNGHVRLLGHYYSVPHTYVGKKESMRKRKTKESEKSLAM